LHRLIPPEFGKQEPLFAPNVQIIEGQRNGIGLVKRENATEDEINCPHCGAVYRLEGKAEHPAPFACRRCGRIMYDGRRKILPGQGS
jgi:predicted RNA-binding Zn-ribbon protein involved in translation (DUF1610 family)